LRVIDQSPGNRHPLALATGQLIGVVVVQTRRQTDQFHGFLDPPAPVLRFRCLLNFQRQADD